MRKTGRPDEDCATARRYSSIHRIARPAPPIRTLYTSDCRHPRASRHDRTRIRRRGNRRDTHLRISST
jgi:hypothetical protein